MNVNMSESMASNAIVRFRPIRTTETGLVTRLIDVMGTMWKKKK